jgi:hypothetical protein|tara:strand:- start:528 stop:1235 length:708 start_codon:yes stop_codon:yes gene_type:complete
MNVSKKKIEEIIKEELSEVGLYHDPKTGRWTKRQTGAVKSLTKKGAKSAGVSDDLVGRGVITAADKVQAKMGMNFSKKTSCGRKTISGDDISSKYKCSDYKEEYAEGINLDGRVSLRDVVEAAETSYNGLEEDLEGACAPLRAKWLKSLLRSLNAIALAQKGDLIPKANESVEDEEETDTRDDWEKRRDAKQRAKTKKIKATAGMYVPKGGFNKSERELLSTNSLWERFCAENSE